MKFSYDKPDGKSLPKNEFFCSKSETDFEKRFFLKTCFSKKIQCTHKMKCSLDNLAEICSPEVRETFLSEVGKSFKDLQFLFFRFECFAGLSGSDYAKPADKYLPLSGDFPLKFRSNL